MGLLDFIKDLIDDDEPRRKPKAEGRTREINRLMGRTTTKRREPSRSDFDTDDFKNALAKLFTHEYGGYSDGSTYGQAELFPNDAGRGLITLGGGQGFNAAGMRGGLDAGPNIVGGGYGGPGLTLRNDAGRYGFGQLNAGDEMQEAIGRYMRMLGG